MAQQPVIPADCPLFEAPSCFRFALIHSIENAATNYLPTNWKGFAEHFRLSVDTPLVFSTPAELIHHWVDKHHNKQRHTISRVLEYAAAKHHKSLEEKFDRVLAEHLVEDYGQKIHPADCFKLCEKCLEWQCGDSPNVQYREEESQSVKANGRVIQHYYSDGSIVHHITYQCEHNKAEMFRGDPPPTHVNGTTVETASQTAVVGDSPRQRDRLPASQPQYNRSSSEGSNNIMGQNPKTRKRLKRKAVSCRLDKLHLFGCLMFDTLPHRLFRRHYHGKTKETIRILFVLFFLYQCLAAILMSMCEDGGLRAVFKTNDKYAEIMNRFLRFSIRLAARFIIPLCCSLQIPILASSPLIPETELSDEEAETKMLEVHEFFSSEEETEWLKHNKKRIYELSEKIGKRKIESIWITMLHSFLYISLLLYLGAFLVCEKNTLKGGVCDFLGVSIVSIPFLQRDFHIIIALESASIFSVLMIIGITIDCYSYESWIGTYAVAIGGKAERLFHEIRHRWIIMDWFSCVSPLVIAGITLLSVSTGRPFTPYPDHSMPVSELVDWYFWILVLTALTFLATSGSRIAKKASLCLYLASGMLLFIVKVEISHIPYGSIMVLLMTSSSAFFLNFLYSLCLSHYYHATLSDCCGQHSLCMFVVCIVCMAILLLSLVGIVYHEISYFGNSFVSW